MNNEKIARLIEELITEELRLVGKTIADARKYEDWYQKFTITPELQAQFEAWAVAKIRKTMRWTKAKAEKEFGMFNLSYGLRELEPNNS